MKAFNLLAATALVTSTVLGAAAGAAVSPSTNDFVKNAAIAGQFEIDSKNANVFD